jgi:hypothetical protein
MGKAPRMTAFRVKPKQCVLVETDRPGFYRHITEGQEFVGTDAQYKHLVDAGAAEVVSETVSAAETVVIQPEPPPSATIPDTPKMKVGRRQ